MASVMVRPSEMRSGDRFGDGTVVGIRFARGGVEVTKRDGNGAVRLVLLNGRRKYRVERADEGR